MTEVPLELRVRIWPGDVVVAWYAKGFSQDDEAGDTIGSLEDAQRWLDELQKQLNVFKENCSAG